ncbi:unnamed protein product [Durusdinium trenchii]|uniref:Uncharacterized protein n=1 Tax=Durusdinium trenchii TaxID=1381693 RepID=A0ABP0K705_9DINO
MLVASVSGMPGVEQIVARQPTRRCAPNFPEVDRYSSMAIGTITYLGVMNQAWNMASISAKACRQRERERVSRSARVARGASLRYFRFHSELPHPVPAERPAQKPGSGWPEQCPPMQAARAFGWDVINPFEIRFDPGEESWKLHDAVEVGGGDLEERGEVGAFDQDNCWQWDPNQVLPHRISPQVFPEIRNQAKVSTYLYLQTPPGWAILMGDIPNAHRRFRILSAMLDTDWYFPAHPWHAVVELPKFVEGEPVIIPAGEPLCRLTPVRRGSYSAAEMRPDQFKMLYEKGQAWLEENGRPSEDPEAPAGALDIRGCYARQQRRFDFQVTPRGAPHAARAAGGVRPA